jgi:hypothetical protein
MSEHDRDNTGLTRREFAALGGAAFLATLLPSLVSCADGSGQVLPTFGGHKAAGDLLSDVTEDLGGGVTRQTTIVSWKSLPPRGLATTQKMIRTITPTPTGEVRDIEMSFDPALMWAVTTTPPGKTKSMQIRYEFVHGPMRGENQREDILTISTTVDGVKGPTARKRVLRTLGYVPSGTPQERFQRGVELVNTHGKIPDGRPGSMQILGDVPDTPDV